jgi:hypothetical protein
MSLLTVSERSSQMIPISGYLQISPVVLIQLPATDHFALNQDKFLKTTRSVSQCSARVSVHAV